MYAALCVLPAPTATLHLCRGTLQGSRRRSQTCSSRQRCQRRDCFLSVSSTSALPLIIFLSINLVPFYAVLFCSNAGHSFNNTKLDESGLLGSSEAGLCSAAADLPASCCMLTHFAHTVGSETPLLLCWRLLQEPPALRLPHPSQALSSPWQWRLLGC